MHVRVRFLGQDAVVVVESKLTTIEEFKLAISEKFNVEPKLQRLIYGGKLLEDGYNFHDYNIKLNDVVQLIQRVQSLSPDDNGETSTSQENEKVPDQSAPKKIEYEDAVSTLYNVGDFVDVRDTEDGYWVEGTITRIVYNPEVGSNDNVIIPDLELPNDDESYTTNLKSNKESDNLLYKVKMDFVAENEEFYYKVDQIRLRARHNIKAENVLVRQVVMINYNIDDPGEVGNWYDFEVENIKKLKGRYHFTGKLYLSSEFISHTSIYQTDSETIFAIEKPVPLSRRSELYKQSIAAPPPKRVRPINCTTCRDNEYRKCKICGCSICGGKENPDMIILCDECDNGFHLKCINPPMTAVPDDDWYCPDCKLDSNEVVAPGAAKQAKKSSSKAKRDWGRGMACVGRTQDCDMPPDHFGPIPGIEVGMIWRFRLQLSENGLHRPTVSGIHGRGTVGAFSIVLSGGYEDDVDNGYEFTYTGSGGRDLSGNKRTAAQSRDQTFTRSNKALARNCAAPAINESGGDAKKNWQNGKPVRVMRSSNKGKRTSKYAPRQGIRYDGIYKVVKYYPAEGLSGFQVFKYVLRRDDPNPAPWEADAKQYDMIYPDGYLEAEAQKKKIKKGKKEPEETDSDDGASKKKKKSRGTRESGVDDSGHPVAGTSGTSTGTRTRNLSDSICTYYSSTECSDDETLDLMKKYSDASTESINSNESTNQLSRTGKTVNGVGKRSKNVKEKQSPASSKTGGKPQKKSPVKGSTRVKARSPSKDKSNNKPKETKKQPKDKTKVSYKTTKSPKGKFVLKKKDNEESPAGKFVLKKKDNKESPEGKFVLKKKGNKESPEGKFVLKKKDNEESPAGKFVLKKKSNKDSTERKVGLKKGDKESLEGKVSLKKGGKKSPEGKVGVKKSSDGTKQLKLNFKSSSKPKKPESRSQDSSKESKPNSNGQYVQLSDKERSAIVADTLNSNIWNECLTLSEEQTITEFIQNVNQSFRCIICQSRVTSPVTTPCLHNFCLTCLKRALSAMERKSCPHCRQSLADFKLNINEALRDALRILFLGYDDGKRC